MLRLDLRLLNSVAEHPGIAWRKRLPGQEDWSLLEKPGAPDGTIPLLRRNWLG